MRSGWGKGGPLGHLNSGNSGGVEWQKVWRYGGMEAWRYGGVVAWWRRGLKLQKAQRYGGMVAWSDEIAGGWNSRRHGGFDQN